MLADDGWGTTGDRRRRGALSSCRLPIAITASAGCACARRRRSASARTSSTARRAPAAASTSRAATPGTGTWQLIDRNRTITNTRARERLRVLPAARGSPADDRRHARDVADRGFGAELGYRRTWSRHGRSDRRRRSARLRRPRPLPERIRSGAGERRQRGAPARAGARRLRRRWRRDRSRTATRGSRCSTPRSIAPMPACACGAATTCSSRRSSTSFRRSTATRSSTCSRSSRRPTSGSAIATHDGPWRATARCGWLRRYAHEDGTASVAGGVDAGVEHAFGSAGAARLDALCDDGYGGRRIGGTGEAAWRGARRRCGCAAG